MLIDRREFALSASAAAGLLLSGCATTRRAAVGCSPLPRPIIDPGRLIRSVAGLRPYRASGFVVRREPLGDKALVHNYGHGGAGITLSWGSSRLAVDLGLAGHQGPVAVVGAGVMGLTTARLVQEAGFPVTIYTAALPAQTTSFVAGGQISPFGHYREDSVSPEWRAQFAAAMDYSWRRFHALAGDTYGVRWLATYEETRRKTPNALEASMPDWRALSPAEHPFPLDHVIRYRTMYVEVPRFLGRLIADFLTQGGKIKVRRFGALPDLAGLPEGLIFNCTGFGARELVGDPELIPVRGQLAVLQPQPELNYAFAGSAGYMFPRPDGVLLGGTFERGEADATPHPEAIAAIIESHRVLFAGLRCAA